MLDWLTPVSPRSVRVRTALSPCSFSRPRPEMKEVRAETASCSHASANSSAVMPLSSAYFSSVSPPLATAFSMPLSVWVMAVPPASASMPTEDMAAASARIWGSLRPARVPADASRVAIRVISASVVAKLLPKSTMTEPSLL